MKKKLSILITLVIVCFLSTSCSYFGVIRGNGHVISSDRNLSGFNSVKSCCGIDVILTQSDTEAVRVEADDNLQQYIKTEVTNNVLNIRRDSKSNLISKNIKVYVNAKDLVNIETSSGSRLETTNQIVAENMELASSSGAGINLDIKSKNIRCSASSGAGITINGQAVTFDVSSSSGSHVKAQDLSTETCKADVSSGGYINLNVTNEIAAEASSGGHVSILGNPKSRNVNKSSGGDVDFR
jgi:hypothetical protein